MSSLARLSAAGPVAVWVAVALIIGVRAGTAGRDYLKGRESAAAMTPASTGEPPAQGLVRSLRALRDRSAAAAVVVSRDPFSYSAPRAVAAAAVPRPSEPDVRVLMTVVEADQSWAKLLVGKRSVSVSVGDTFQGKRVVKIDSGGVVLRGAGGETRLRFR